MVLKEAYHYQNHLTDLIAVAQRYLLDRSFITLKKETHNRKKANPDATDETIEVKAYDVDFTPTNLVDFIMSVIDEKQKLSDAIAEAKKNAEIDIDSSIAMNKIKQGYISILKYMSDVKPSVREYQSKDYRFDVNNEQKPYYYTVSEEISINFDRNNVRKLAKKLQNETDGISTKLDAIQLTTKVDFTPKWDVSDTLEDIIGVSE